MKGQLADMQAQRDKVASNVRALGVAGADAEREIVVVAALVQPNELGSIKTFRCRTMLRSVKSRRRCLVD